jgi:hypothetical protein
MGSPKHFIVHISGPGGFGAPDIGRFDLGVIPSGGSTTIDLPPLGSNNCDARNETIDMPAGGGGGGGAVADLLLESIFFDTLSNTFQFESNGNFLANAVGYGVVVKIPDLWADTNHDGSLDTGDVLYSLVNLEQYLAGPIPTFTPGQTFNIVNGQVASLPGMLFSTTPFTFDPTTGPSGTPYTGNATALTDHEPVTMPEPGTIGLIGCGLVLLWRTRRRISA